MLKNNKFFFTKVATKEFDLLKQVLSSSPVLSLPDFSQPFAIGAVLMQNQHPFPSSVKPCMENTYFST